MKPGAVKNVRIKEKSPGNSPKGGMRHTYAGAGGFPKLGKANHMNAT